MEKKKDSKYYFLLGLQHFLHQFKIVFLWESKLFIQVRKISFLKYEKKNIVSSLCLRWSSWKIECFETYRARKFKVHFFSQKVFFLFVFQ